MYFLHILCRSGEVDSHCAVYTVLVKQTAQNRLKVEKVLGWCSIAIHFLKTSIQDIVFYTVKENCYFLQVFSTSFYFFFTYFWNSVKIIKLQKKTNFQEKHAPAARKLTCFSYRIFYFVFFVQKNLQKKVQNFTVFL